jgi:hypothetical protein
MFNPFVKFEPRFIPAFRNQKKRYLVSQTFSRGKDLFTTDKKVYLMLTHYDDSDKAKIHYKAIVGNPNNIQPVINEKGELQNFDDGKKDKYAAILDLEKDEHRKKLEEMLSPNSQYIIYSSLIQDPKIVERAMDTIFKDKIKKYIDRKTNWRIPRDYTLIPRPELTFGELYIVMKFAGQTARIKLEDLENI